LGEGKARGLGDAGQPTRNRRPIWDLEKLACRIPADPSRSIDPLAEVRTYYQLPAINPLCIETDRSRSHPHLAPAVTATTPEGGGLYVSNAMGQGPP